jgi:hypothetical protein
MSEPRSRIDALLNFSTPTAEQAPVAAPTGAQGPVAAPAPDQGPVAAPTGAGGQAQEIPFVAATQQAAGSDHDPGLQVFVDGRPLQTNSDGSADFEVTPRGTTPLPGLPPARSGRGSEHPGNATHQGGAVPPGGNAAHGGSGTSADPWNASDPGGASANAASQKPDGVPGSAVHTGAGGRASNPSSPWTPAGHEKSGAARHAGEEVKGLGKHPAEADIIDPHGKGHVPFHVHRNHDGSLDIVVPKGHGHPHEVRIHVPPGHHVKLNLSEDSKGHVKVQAKPVPPADHQKPTPAGSGKGGNAQPSKAADPKAGNKAPGGGSGGGPSGGGPSGGGPSGGGGGPSSGGGAPGGGTPPTNGNNGQNPGGGTRTADPDAMRKLGNDIDSQCGSIMDQAKQQTQKINISYPAFGVLGFMFNSAHNGVQSDAVNYISSGRNMLNQWKGTLGANADNWGQAESNSTL